jgi:hypothetical protein
MVFSKCPGAASVKEPKPEYIKCPYCGEPEVEIWSDEAETKCHVCEGIIYRELSMSCLEWCKFARECVGEEAYQKYLEQKNSIRRSKEESG